MSRKTVLDVVGGASFLCLFVAGAFAISYDDDTSSLKFQLSCAGAVVSGVVGFLSCAVNAITREEDDCVGLETCCNKFCSCGACCCEGAGDDEPKGLVGTILGGLSGLFGCTKVEADTDADAAADVQMLKSPTN